MSESPSIKDSLLEKLNCSICLETFTLPLSLPCGHNFCQRCIHQHWDSKELQMAAMDCPVCRMVFETRPEPKKNLNLTEVVEQVRAYKRSPLETPRTSEKKVEDSRRVCPRHDHVLSIFCSTDRRCICHECVVKECKGHELTLIEHERQDKEKRLVDVLRANQSYREQEEGKIANLTQLLQDTKDSCNKMVSGISMQFDQVKEMLDECSSLAKESIRKDERAAVGQALANRDHLQNHLSQLSQHKKEAEQLLQTSDNVTFLQGLAQIVSPGSPPVLADVPVCGMSQVDAVTAILSEITNLLKVRLPDALYPGMPAAGKEESQASASPARPTTKLRSDSNAMSELRTQMHKDYRNLTFEPKSANKYIQLSRQNTKAFHSPDTAAPNQPERFQTWQVVCAEGFSEGHHYWEVEVSRFFVHVGVAYSCLPLTTGEQSHIGRNPFSWGLHVLCTRHSAWHDNKEERLPASKYQKIGISLDCAAGNLTFYGVQDGGLVLIHSFNCIFQQALYPAFFIGEDTIIKLCRK